MRTLVSTCLWMIATGIGSADPSQWGQFYARQEWEAHRQANRNIDHYNRYDPNPRSSPVQLLPLQNQLAQWAARIDEERQHRAADQANRNLVLIGILKERQREAQEQARLATLERWRGLLQQAAQGDVDTSYRVARLIRWGEGRLPAEQKTGDEPAKPWYRFAADRGHADAALELASLLASSSPADALRYYTRAAEGGRPEAILPAADLAEEGIPGRLPANPTEALRLLRLGVQVDSAPHLTHAAFLVLRQPDPSPESFARAVDWLNQAASREPAAAGRLALIRLNDQPGLRADPKLAVTLARAALVKDPDQRDALLTLGLARFDGVGGETVQTADALDLLRRAASAGSARACDALALAFGHGMADLAVSDSESLSWRREGARLGHIRSMLELAVRHQLGKGVERNPSETVRLYTEAAVRGSVPAIVELARFLVARDSAFPVDPVRVRSLAAAAARSGLPEAEELYGAILLDGLGGPKQGPDAVPWIRSAAEAGARGAQYLLGMMKLEALFMEADPAGAFEWMKRAAEAESPDACGMLAWFHVTGTGCAQDSTLAREWAAKGAGLGSTIAHRVLGTYLGLGVGGPVDGPGAVKHLSLATEQKDEPARLQLAEFLRDGLPGVPSDRATARLHLEQAARSRNTDIAGKARAALENLSRPRPVAVTDLLISRPVPGTNRPSLYDSLRLRPSTP